MWSSRRRRRWRRQCQRLCNAMWWLLNKLFFFFLSYRVVNKNKKRGKCFTPSWLSIGVVSNHKKMCKEEREERSGGEGERSIKWKPAELSWAWRRLHYYTQSNLYSLTTSPTLSIPRFVFEWVERENRKPFDLSFRNWNGGGTVASQKGWASQLSWLISSAISCDVSDARRQTSQSDCLQSNPLSILHVIKVIKRPDSVTDKTILQIDRPTLLCCVLCAGWSFVLAMAKQSRAKQQQHFNESLLNVSHAIIIMLMLLLLIIGRQDTEETHTHRVTETRLSAFR